MFSKLLGLVLLVSLIAAPVFAEELTIEGAGPSTAIAEDFFRLFSYTKDAAGFTFIVPPKSSKHDGGVRNSDVTLFGRTGRPLNEKEKAAGKMDIPLAKIPITFVVGKKVGLAEMTITQVEAIFTGKITNWKELGGPDQPIYVIGREPSEVIYSKIVADYPGFANAKFDKVLERDDLVVKLFILPKSEYGISFGAKPNFDAKELTVLRVKDFDSGIVVGLVYDQSKATHRLIKPIKEFARSEKWAKALETSGLRLP